MAENKFIERLQGKGTEKSVVEIKNTATPTMFTNMPAGDSNGFNTYSDHRGNATVVANGTMNWKVDSLQTLTPTNIVNGNGEDFTTSMATSGAGLWINAEYTFPSTGDPSHPVAMVFNPQTKWVLKVCGDNLLSPTSNTIDFTVLITFGSSNIISKTFTVAEQANKFCKEFVIDFSESNTNIIKAQGLSTMKLQLLCGTADASANIYGGMTVLTCLQRKVEAVAISSTFANVEEVLRDGLLPNDYFSNGAYIAQVTDGDTAYAVFQRDGDEMLFVGWHQPIPDQTGNSGKFLMTNGSLMSWEQLTISDVEGLQDDLDDLQNQITTNKNTMDNHIANTSNPHSVTAAQIGLGNCDNTADLDKPISTATQTALDTKATPADITSAISTHNADLSAHSNIISPIQEVIPTAATSSNQLADKNFVNSSIATSTATFRGTYNSLAELEAQTADENDYGFVVSTDAVGNTIYNRYKYTTSTTPASWVFEYALNNSSFTATQWDAINSGANTTNIGQIATNTSAISSHTGNTSNPHSVTKAQVGLSNVDNTSDLDKPISTATQTALNGKQATISDLATIRSNAQAGKTASDTIATYGDIVTHDVAEFATAAQGAKADSALQPGDNVSELVNDAGYLTQHQSLSDLGITATASEINVLDGITATTTELNYTDGVTSNIQSQLDGKQATISDLSTIRSGAAAGATAVQSGDLATVATTGSYSDLSDTPTIGNATLTIKKNSVAVDTFTANATVDKSINIIVPVNAADVNALPNTTKYVANASMTIDNTTYVVTLQLKDQDGNNIGTAQTVDLPLESVVVSGAYDSVNKKIVLTLKDGSTIDIPVGDLVAGLQAEITSTNKLDADLVDDSTSTNKFVTASDKTTWNGKQDAISDLTTIRSNASSGASAYTTIQGYGNIVTHNASEFATSAQGALADTAVQPGDLASVATSGSYNDLSDKPTIPTVNNATLTIQKNGTTVQTFTANQSINATANISVPTKTSDITNDSGFITSSALAPYALSADLATVATSGSYNDLSNKPTIPAAQVNSDWNANSGVAQILNKPTLATVATSGSYNDLSNKPTIPTVNNPTITITQGGITKGSFTLNQASGDTIALDAGGGVGNIDNITITANADDEIQAVGTVNQNTATGATNPIYDWVGTLAEYTSQAVATNHPDWMCYITDDIGGSATEIGQITETLNDKVDKGHEVIEFQAPTVINGYTWYRKYADGWVEQGGIVLDSESGNYTVNLPVAMADTNYDIQLTCKQNANGSLAYYMNQTTTSFVREATNRGGTTAGRETKWRVEGMAA